MMTNLKKLKEQYTNIASGSVLEIDEKGNKFVDCSPAMLL